MQEQTFLNEHGVTVTNARFVVASQTYAMAGITSVKNYYEAPSRLGPLVIFMTGMFVCAINIFVGLMIIAFGVFLWIVQKPNYQILLATSGGEVKALVSQDSQHINNVIRALNDAIVARG